MPQQYSTNSLLIGTSKSLLDNIQLLHNKIVELPNDDRLQIQLRIIIDCYNKLIISDPYSIACYIVMTNYTIHKVGLNELKLVCQDNIDNIRVVIIDSRAYDDSFEQYYNFDFGHGPVELTQDMTCHISNSMHGSKLGHMHYFKFNDDRTQLMAWLDKIIADIEHAVIITCS